MRRYSPGTRFPVSSIQLQNELLRYFHLIARSHIDERVPRAGTWERRRHGEELTLGWAQTLLAANLYLSVVSVLELEIAETGRDPSSRLHSPEGSWPPIL